ncbi:uncharacterized protein N7482_002967 [Penicillium canariense]|uniref:Zn(2)-C6 fungal-type domain-containing protein n=1 Tax=Penicillium canariense TaxID=189055 RepID=A0A9W9IH49_9EURO|nr:uncharacterized protein N7482_002967 [Penicillium canariense]KAJ5177090.1 hypothetical protein N7482_002967 [Penicillium canariense]
MSSSSPTTTTGAGGRAGPPTTQKLKDSCDPCSSSKVKCNKEKPVCSRCRKLGYPCFYSPARRIGRPHPTRRSVSRKSPEPHPSCSTRECVVNSSMCNTAQGSQVLAKEAQLHQGPQPSILDGTEPSAGGVCAENPLHWFHDVDIATGGVDDTETKPTAALNEASYILNEEFNHKQISSLSQSPLADLEFFNLSDVLNGDSNWLDLLQSEANWHFIPLEIPLAQSSSQASSAGVLESGDIPSGAQTPMSDSPEPDCVTRAIDILRRLQTSHNKITNETQTSSLGYELSSRVQTAAWAINRLSMILICPCSRKIYVAILVAAVCMAILDVYDSLFQQEQDQNVGHYLKDRSQGVVMGFPPAFEMNSNGCGVRECAEFTGLESVEVEADISPVHILEELSKLANVVMQFSRRYKGDARTQSTGTLSALADSLKLRLRSVTNEALDWKGSG